MGCTSRKGSEFNVMTICHMLENPKYKGWCCGSKTQLPDYRTKKKAFPEGSEWGMYPRPDIPAIVPEELRGARERPASNRKHAGKKPPERGRFSQPIRIQRENRGHADRRAFPADAARLPRFPVYEEGGCPVCPALLPPFLSRRKTEPHGTAAAPYQFRFVLHACPGRVKSENR